MRGLKEKTQRSYVMQICNITHMGTGGINGAHWIRDNSTTTDTAAVAILQGLYAYGDPIRSHQDHKYLLHPIYLL
jgi:hypothetical protein